MEKKIGLIVPSSNTTMEKEIPKMLRERAKIRTDTSFSFHSSRTRMKTVSKKELDAMNVNSERCALELSDAHCDVIAYACLVAIMSQGSNFHIQSEEKLRNVTLNNGRDTPIVSSAGSLISALNSLKAKKVSIVAPYKKPLTQMVISYIEKAGFEVIDSISLEVTNNIKVGKLNPMNLIDISENLDTNEADTLIISACVQMQSLKVIETLENKLNIPVVSAATSTVYQLLKKMDLETFVPNAGTLLSGKY